MTSREEFTKKVKWPDPAPEPDHEPHDDHTGPLDDEEDARFLDPFDRRRMEAEKRRGKGFG